MKLNISTVQFPVRGYPERPQYCAVQSTKTLLAMRFLRRWRSRILLFFVVIGPGFITANVDNDANGIVTYSQAGAQFGYRLLWTMIPVTLALILVQEISARMGAVTGKGLSDLIREEFGLRITFIMMVVILLINFGNILGEFAGIAGSLELFGLSKYYTGADVCCDRLANGRERPVQGG
jgi:Mn2+/Fe2+ NRAMP family transporter